MPSVTKPEEREGKLKLSKQSGTKFFGLYEPGEMMAAEAGVQFGVTVKMLEVDLKRETVSVYPLITIPTHPDFLEPKYNKIKKITSMLPDQCVAYLKQRGKLIDDDDLYIVLSEGLLPGFVHDPDYGLGIAKVFKDVIDAVEEHSDSEILLIADGVDTSEYEGFFALSLEDYSEAKRKINSVTSLGQNAAAEVRDAAIYNLLASRLGVPNREIRFGRSPVRKGITAAALGLAPLTDGDQTALIDALSKHKKQVASSKPEALVKLQEEIELVTLEVLISRYEDMLEVVTDESDWQAFFRENSFALTMAFGYPIVVIAEQASVGGGQLMGGGSKYSDFLVKNSQTHNAAIFEIKTPGEKLLNKTPYRGKVYSATSAFSGAIAQVLDQRYQFVKALPALRDNDRGLVLESYAVGCCLVIGKTPADIDEKKSFELFRRNSRDVEIITFDELLEKLRQLHTFLSSKSESKI